LDQKHSTINISDQEKAAQIWLTNKDCVRFIAADQFTPVGSKINEDIALIQLPEPFSSYADGVSNMTMSAIACGQVVRMYKGRGSSRAVSDRRRYAPPVLSERNQLGVVTYVDAALSRRLQENRLQSTLWAVPRGWFWSHNLRMADYASCFIDSRKFLLFR
jgi:hypothetical protein